MQGHVTRSTCNESQFAKKIAEMYSERKSVRDMKVPP